MSSVESTMDTYSPTEDRTEQKKIESAAEIKSMTTPETTDLSVHYLEQRDVCASYFDTWTEQDQVSFVEHLVGRMCHYQHGQINSYLKPMLQRDFISALPAKGLDHIAETILSFLGFKSLCRAEGVCKEWYRVISEGMLWKKLIERNVRTDNLWRGLAERRGWAQFLFRPRPGEVPKDHRFYRDLYPQIIHDIERIENNWRTGQHTLQRIHCRSETSKGVYCLQYDDQKIVSGLRDNTIKIWDRNTLDCVQVLTGHTGSVLCLQYDENIIISGSSDSTVRVWDVRTGEMLNTLIHHCEAVLHLRFNDGIMVTCSKDRSIAVWDMQSSTDINLRRVLVGHRAAVNVVDFDERYIVSASGDRTIKVWSTSTCEFVRTLSGHKRGIACLQYRDRLVVSGSSDNTIRLWDIECGACLRVLEGHEELVRCIRFDNKRIVSGAYDGQAEYCADDRMLVSVTVTNGSVRVKPWSIVPVMEGAAVLDLYNAVVSKTADADDSWPGLPENFINASTTCFIGKNKTDGDRKIKVWDLAAALDPRAPTGTLCLRTLVNGDNQGFNPVILLQEHSGRVFRLQFDEFQIVSSSHDDTILIWDFLNVSTNEASVRSPSRTYTYVSK